jgi:ADP-glucose pyrophosphorylase
VSPHRMFTIVLAGGAGKRLAPLTADRAKPAVPFGGNYRLIDFALSNLVNAGFLRIAVLTQYKSHSLDRHISTTWRLSRPTRSTRTSTCSTTSGPTTSSFSVPTTSTAWTRARCSTSTSRPARP